MSQKHATKERRQHPRLDWNIPLKLCSEDNDIVTETQNLSRTGAYCRIKTYIEPMTKLKICLLLPFKRNGKVTTKKVACEGIIVRTESILENDSYNIAIYFNDIKKREADCITDYINISLDSNSPPLSQPSG